MRLHDKKLKTYNAAFQPADEVLLLQSGEAYFTQLLNAIHNARSTIHFHCYIFDPDDTGTEVATALLLAASRGVMVSVVIDGYGSGKFPEDWIIHWTTRGIKVHRFSKISLFRNLNLGRRLHHKVIVIDDTTSFVGGINIADKYRGSSSEIPWLDFAIKVSGNACRSIRKICDQIEERSFPVFNELPAIKYQGQNTPQINIRQNDWLRNKRQIYFSYLMAFQKAEHYITLFASYFLPGRKLMKAIEKASKRGVKIRLVLAGKSDIPIFLNASLYFYQWLLRNKVELYEWNHSVMHAKLALVDDQWMTVGSFNLNHLSTYASIELNVDVLYPGFTKECSIRLNQLIENSCDKIEMKHSTGFLRKLAEYLAYLAGRSLIQLITFFPGFRKNNRRAFD